MKNYIIKTILFITISLSINIIIQYSLLKDRESFLFYIKKRLSKQSECIMFGSSVNAFTQPHWKDKRTISTLVDSTCANIFVNTIFRASASIENYYNYLEYATKQNNIPKIVITPINIRAFSHEWGKRPEYTALIARERIFLNYGIIPYLCRKIIPQFSNEINAQTHEMYFEEPVFINGNKIGEVKDFSFMENLTIKDTSNHYKNAFRFSYMSDILGSDRKVQYLLKFDSLCKYHNIEVIYYFTPIDYTTGEKYLGNSFSEKLQTQASFFKTLLNRNNKNNIVDLMFELDSTYFCYDLMPNEHLFQNGKQFIAEKVSIELKSRLAANKTDLQ